MKLNLLGKKILTGLFCALFVIAPMFVAASAFADDTCGEGFTKQGPLCVPDNPFNGSDNSLVNQTTAGGLIATVIRILLFFGGIIAVLFVIIGGYYYMTARGNEEQATKGRHTLMYALIGLALIMLSYAIVTIFTNQLISNV